MKCHSREIFPIIALSVLLITGCGGGGGGDAGSASTGENPQLILTDGPGDVNNIFPLTVGNRWGYHVTGYETGQPAVDYTQEITVSGTKQVDSNTAFVLTSFNIDNPGGVGEEYFFKNKAAVYYLGDNALSIPLPITPYPIIKFPEVQNGSFLQVNKSGIDYGTDVDGDGRNESLAIHSNVTVAGYESVTVDTGTLGNCARLVTTITETLTSSRDRRQAEVSVTVSEWYAPGIGLVKRHAEYGYPGWSRVTDYSLKYYSVEGRKSDTTPPAVATVQPSAGSTLGAVASVRVVFSEDVDPASINTSSLVLSDAAGRPVPGDVSYLNKTATFIPASSLTAGTYTATVTTLVQDKMANLLAANYSWSFTLDRTAPYLITTSPSNGVVNLPVTSVISATFSEPLSGYSIDYRSFTVTDNNNNGITGQVSYSNNVATFTPVYDLAWDTTYTATVTTAVRDVVGNPLASSYTWSFSTPRGLFLSPITLATGSSFPQAVAIGDVNGDGRKDVIVVNSFYNDSAHDGKVLAYLQNVAGGLDQPVVYSTSGTFGNPPQTVAIEDINHDGRNDVVIGNSGKNIEVFLQNVSGGLDPGVPYATSDSNKIRITDLNNDGLADIVGIGPGNNSVSIWYQGGNGALNAPVSYSATHTGRDDLDVGDVNNDGLSDIIVMNGGQGSLGRGQGISVLTQKPDGTFNPAVDSAGSFIFPGGVAVGDITGDNRKDVVMTYGGNWPGSNIAVYSQNSSGTLNSQNSFDSYDSPAAVEIADVDGDGRNDIIVLHNGWAAAGVYSDLADGTLQAEDRYRMSVSNSNPQAMAVGDINGDGLTDIAALEINGALTILYHKPTPSPGKAIAQKATAVKGISSQSFKGVRLRRY